MADEIRFVDEPSPGDLERLEEQIDQFNFRTTGFYDGRALAAFLRDEAGALRAGLAGHTWGGCAEIKLLWVRETERRYVPDRSSRRLRMKILRCPFGQSSRKPMISKPKRR